LPITSRRGFLEELARFAPDSVARRLLGAALESSQTGPVASLIGERRRQMELVRELLLGSTYPPPQRPLVARLVRPTVVLGVAHAFTDIDAFLADVLGSPVPRRPRYRRDPLVLPMAVEDGGESAPQQSMPTGPRESVRNWLWDQTDQRARHLIRLLAPRLRRRDPTLAAFADLFGRRDIAPQLPLQGVFSQVLRRGPYSRSPSLLRNFNPVLVLRSREPWRDLLVVWWPALPRADVAARIRYLHRTEVAPWATSRTGEERLGRFLAYLARLGSPRAPMTDVAAFLRERGISRERDGEDWLRALEHWSAEAHRWSCGAEVSDL